MSLRILPFFLLSALLLTAFQCGQKRWIEFASKFKIEVIPEIVNLTSDTLAFEILIDPEEYKIEPDQKLTFNVYAIGNGDEYLVDQIDLMKLGVLKKQITHVLGTTRRITALTVVFHQYNSGRPKSVSPP